MEIDIAQLAAQTAALLAPYLPYLIKGGKIAAKKAFEKAGEKFVEKGWEGAEALYEKFKPKIEVKEAAQEAVEDVIETPDDKNAQASFEHQIKKILEKDAAFAREVDGLIQAGDYSQNLLAKDIADSNVIVGNSNTQTNIGAQNNTTIGTQVNADQVVMQTGGDHAKADKAFHIYLQKLRRDCLALPLATLGGDDDDNTILTDIYIELDTTVPKETKQAEKEQRGLLGREEKVSVMEAAIKTSQMVLLGDAGSGKSTFVKELLALQVSAWLDKKPVAGFDPKLAPVLIILRELAPRLAGIDLNALSGERQRQALADAILEKINDDIKQHKADDCIPIVQDAIEQGNLLLVMDGLDEVPQSARHLVRRAVGALIQSHAIQRVIITCRSRSYTGATVFPNFAAFEVAKLDNEKIGKFALRWYQQKHRQGHRKADEVEPRAADLTRAATNENLSQMASNPMMLTSIAILHHKNISLPPQRVKLYDEIVKILTSRWQKYKTADANLTPSADLANFINNDTFLRAALERLAYEAHRVTYSEGGDRKEGEDQYKETDLPRGKALEILETLFREKGVGGLALADEFLDYIDKRAGILVGKGGDAEDLENPLVYSFPHRTIQEYLAGCHMVGSRKRHEEYFNRTAEGDFWSLAGLMGAEDLYHRRSLPDEMLLLAYKLCRFQPPENEQEQRALVWSGQIACVAGLQEIKAEDDGIAYLERLIPRTVALIEASRLTPRERAEAGDTLAKLGDPRFGETHWQLPKEPLLGFVHIPAGEFLMGTKESDIKSLIEKFGGDEEWYKRETPQHPVKLPDYYMARYPVTVAQFKAFIEDSKYKPQDENSLRGHPNHPVVYVTWYDALEYCKWLTAKLKGKAQQVAHSAVELRNEPERSFWQGLAQDKLLVTLPSEAEWEKAASWLPSPSGRGVGGEGKPQIFPWGDDFDQNKVNNNNVIGSTSAVGCFPKGNSPYKIHDMSGNVWEWTRSLWGKDWQKPEFIYPYENIEQRENLDAPREIVRVLRGGAFRNDEGVVRCASRNGGYPGLRVDYFGYRVVVVASPISL